MQPNQNKLMLGITGLIAFIVLIAIIFLSLTRQSLTEAQQVALGQAVVLATSEANESLALTRESNAQITATEQAIVIESARLNEALALTQEASALNDVAEVQAEATKLAIVIETVQSNEALALAREADALKDVEKAQILATEQAAALETAQQNEAEAVDRAESAEQQRKVDTIEDFDAQEAKERSNTLLSLALAGFAGELDEDTTQTNLLLAIESNLLLDDVNFTSNLAFVAINSLAQRFPKLTEKTEPDKDRYAIWSSDRTQKVVINSASEIAVKNVASNEIIHTFELGAGSNRTSIIDILWNPDGTRILTLHEESGIHAVEAQFVQIWDAVTGELLRSFIDEDWYTLTTKWSRDGLKIVTGSLFGDVIIWDAATLEPLYTLRHREAVNQVQWNINETQLLTNGDDAGVWDLATGERTVELRYDGTAWRDVQWNANETQILTIGWHSGLVGIWDATSGEVLQTFEHRDSVDQNGDVVGLEAKWDSEEKRLLTYNKDGVINIWDALNGNLIQKITHDDHVTDVKWNSKGDLILVSGGSVDRVAGSAKVWDVESGELLYVFPHDVRVQESMWNTAETQVLTRSNDGIAKIWNATNGELIYLLEHDATVIDARWLENDTQVLSISADRSTWVWDIAENVSGFKPLHSSPIVVVNGDKTLFLSSQFSKDRLSSIVSVWNTNENRLLHTLVHDDLVQSMRWNDDETQILTVSKSANESKGAVNLWDAKSGRLLHKLVHDQPVWSASWNTNETQILSIDQNSIATVWNTDDGELVYTLEHAQHGQIWGSGAINAKWIANGTQILTYGDNSDTVNVWESQTGRLLHNISPENETITDVELNTNGTQALIFSHSRWYGDAELWDLTSGKLIHQFEHYSEEDPWQGADGGIWNNDGTQILTYDDTGSIRVWDVLTGTLLFEFQYGDTFRALNSVMWHKNETQILAYGKDGAIKFWDASDGTLLKTLNHDADVWHIRWNKNETQMLTVEGHSAKVWDELSGELIHTLTHDNRVSVARWSEDETQILTYGNDRVAKVWNASNGLLLFTLEGDGTGVDTAYWNKDETQMMLWTRNGNFYRYLMQAEDRRELACQRATRNLTWTEWQRFLPSGDPYRVTCPNRPVHPSVPVDQRP